MAPQRLTGMTRYCACAEISPENYRRVSRSRKERDMANAYLLNGIMKPVPDDDW
jgi:hypothetical protein